MKEAVIQDFPDSHYNPSSGRFISPDPIGFAGGDLNLYRYVGNNPVNFVDPSGLTALAPIRPIVLRTTLPSRSQNQTRSGLIRRNIGNILRSEVNIRSQQLQNLIYPDSSQSLFNRKINNIERRQEREAEILFDNIEKLIHESDQSLGCGI